MLWAYLDDSGKWDWHKSSTPSLGFAGAVASVSKWCAFIREWREILDIAGVQHFHASEWSRRSDTFLSLLAPCVCKWARPVGSVMPQIALALGASVQLGDRDQRPRAYDFAFENCLIDIADRAAEVGDRAHVVLSQNTEYNQRAHGLFRKFKTDYKHGGSLGTFTGDVSYRDLPQLEAADLAAWSLVRPLDDPMEGAPGWRNEASVLFTREANPKWLHTDLLRGHRSLLDPDP
jgi:hypothetical protein